MRRREFLKTSGAVLATAALPAGALLAARPVDGAQPSSTRIVLPINRGWRYKPAQVAGAEAPGFDDSGFERVVVPLTNVRLPWHNFDDHTYEFVSTYRRRFKYPQGAEGKRVFVDFEGVMTASTVWINGHPLGEYKGGFTPFSFELTPHLSKDQDNVLTVQVDSTERQDIPPFGYEIDYLTFGGIYREVSLRIVPSVYLDNIFARPNRVLSANPALDVDCFLAGKAQGPLSLEVELRDGDRVVARQSQAIEASGSAADPDAALDPTTSAPAYQSTETDAV